jgi:hypothetical protein
MNNCPTQTSVIPLRGLHIAPKLLNPKANDGYGEQAERARRDGWRSVRSLARNGTVGNGRTFQTMAQQPESMNRGKRSKQSPRFE